MLNDVKPPPLDRPEPMDTLPNPPAPANTAGPVPGVVFNPPTVPHSTTAGGPARGVEAHPSGHVVPNVDEKEIGRHKTRFVGDHTRINPIYAMPLEDRGSTFSIGLSIVVIVVFVSLIAIVFFSIR